MRAMRSLAGLEKEHSNMLQVDTESLQPHWHCMRAPTRRTSALGFSATVWASAAPARMAIRASFERFTTVHRSQTVAALLPLNNCMFLRVTHYFRADVLHLHLARDQADQRSADQNEPAHPNPGDQRKNISLDH